MLARMGPLAALLVATPVFGFSLSVAPSLAAGPSLSNVPVVAAVQTSAEGGEESGSDASPGAPTVAEQMQERGRLAKLHRALGIATWASMTGTVVLGFLQYWNLYGGGGLADTPCVQGDAIFGQSSCTRQPLPHLISSIATTALYSVTFGLSLRMPDPMNLSEGDSDYAQNLRRHKRLRWVHLAGMVAQLALGAIIANGDSFGLSRANDYSTLKALSTVHMAIGLVTYGTMTWAGTIFLF